MELTRRLARWRYVYGWRVRYWWLDTPGGLRARLTALIVIALVALLTIAVAGIAAFNAGPGQRQIAVGAWIASLIVSIGAAWLCRRKRRGKTSWIG